MDPHGSHRDTFTTASFPLANGTNLCIHGVAISMPHTLPCEKTQNTESSGKKTQ
jgi:hypothetical protein